MSERELARVAGISQPHLHNILNGKRTGTDDVLDKLASAARVYAADDERNQHDPSAWWHQQQQEEELR